MAEIVELEICYICDDSFQDLEEHFYDKHTSWKIYKCDICNKDYNSDNELQKHKIDFHTLNSDIKENVTNYKEQKFSLEDQTCKGIYGINIKGQKENIIENEVITINHSISSPKKSVLLIKGHKCVSCGKSFSAAHVLKRHIYTVHEGHKDHKCESCSKTFSQLGNLKFHIHTVHGHKDHKCESCSKTFSLLGHLKYHIHRVHEIHKDKKCESCGKSFTRAYNLKKHIRTVHSNQ